MKILFRLSKTKQEDKYEIKSLIQMINIISDNHQRIFNFIEKIERI